MRGKHAATLALWLVIGVLWVLASALAGCSDAEECTYAGGGNEYCTELYVCCTRSGCSVIADDIEIPCDAGDCDQAFAAGALWSCQHGIDES